MSEGKLSYPVPDAWEAWARSEGPLHGTSGTIAHGPQQGVCPHTKNGACWLPFLFLMLTYMSSLGIWVLAPCWKYPLQTPSPARQAVSSSCWCPSLCGSLLLDAVPFVQFYYHSPLTLGGRHRPFSKDDIQMADRCMRRFSTSPVLRETHTKATRRQERLGQKGVLTGPAGKGWRGAEGAPLGHRRWGCKSVQLPRRTGRMVLKTLHTELPCDPAIPALGLNPEKRTTRVENMFTSLYCGIAAATAKMWQSPSCPPTGKRIQNTRCELPSQ